MLFSDIGFATKSAFEATNWVSPEFQSLSQNFIFKPKLKMEEEAILVTIFMLCLCLEEMLNFLFFCSLGFENIKWTYALGNVFYRKQCSYLSLIKVSPFLMFCYT